MTNDVDRQQLAEAHRRAGLHGTLDEALADPVLALCLRNMAKAPPMPPRWFGVDQGGADRTLFHSVPTPSDEPAVDIKRRASGDFD